MGLKKLRKKLQKQLAKRDRLTQKEQKVSAEKADLEYEIRGVQKKMDELLAPNEEKS